MSTHKQAADKQAESCVLAIDEGKKNLLIEMLDRVTWRGFQETVMLSQIISILNGATFVLTNIPITKP
jgi:hypothetical protein